MIELICELLLLNSTDADADGDSDHLMLITADLTMRLDAC